jgi:toxin ParE1/3/4
MPAKPHLEWRAHARADLLEIVSHIADDNPDAAQALKDDIEAQVAALPGHPKLFKASTRVKGLRELVGHSNYIVLYRETAALVEIVNVVHARRQFPDTKKKRKSKRA